MKQRKEEMVEKCLEAYFHLTVKGEEYCLFQDKDGNLHKPHHKEDGLYVFLQESPKTDVITYVKELHKFCTKIVKYDMETKELKISIPEGYEIDKNKSTFERIIFKKKDTKPKSWEEYRAKVPENKLYKVWGVVEGKELAEAFLAMMQLMSLRQAWIGDWKPDWENSKQYKANILCNNGEFIVGYFKDLISRPLSFPTKEMAEDFINTFKDLLKIAKPLI